MLALLSLLGGLAAALRPARERRLERVGLVLHHGVAFGVAVAAVMGALLGGGDGRPLLLCAVAPLLVLAMQDVVSPRIAMASVPLVGVGLVAQALVLLRIAPADWTGVVCAALALAATVPGALLLCLRARQEPTPRARALQHGQALALAVAACAAMLALLPADVGGGVWAVGLGAAGVLGTAGRLRPSSPPGVRDAAGAMVLFVCVLAGAAAIPLAPGETAFVASWVTLGALGSFALVRAALEERAGSTGVVPAAPATAALPSAALPSARALAAMAPLLDDALLRRPGRPRLVARVPARRILEAALERARTTQPRGRGPRDDLARVEVVAPDGEVDVDGDPADLAEALCAILDNALRVRARQPEVRVQVHIRSSPGAVTFEVSDSAPDAGPEGTESPAESALPDPDAPFLNPRLDDVDRPGLGVALARARLLVERNGGILLTHFGVEGSTVEVTMPRRMSRGAVGQA